MVCEVCGKTPAVHLTAIRDGVKASHHYCWDHVPPELNVARPTVSQDLETIAKLIAAAEAKDLPPEQKAAFRQQLEREAEVIKAGRRRLGDAG
jgi:hypothetical protein